MIYIIDHQDSFTWNVVHQFAKFDKVFCSNYYELNNKLLDKSDVIVLSPGPGSPKDYPTTSKIYKKYKGRKKIIGICLGYQMILHNEGGKIIQQKKIYHGFQSKIKTNNQSATSESRPRRRPSSGARPLPASSRLSTSWWAVFRVCSNSARSRCTTARARSAPTAPSP